MIIKWMQDIAWRGAKTHIVNSIADAIDKNLTDANEIQSYHSRANEYDNILARMSNNSIPAFLTFYIEFFCALLIFIEFAFNYPNLHVKNILLPAIVFIVVLLIAIAYKIKNSYYRKYIDLIILQNVYSVDLMSKILRRDKTIVIKDLFFLLKKQWIYNSNIDLENGVFCLNKNACIS